MKCAGICLRCYGMAVTWQTHRQSFFSGILKTPGDHGRNRRANRSGSIRLEERYKGRSYRRNSQHINQHNMMHSNWRCFDRFRLLTGEPIA